MLIALEQIQFKQSHVDFETRTQTKQDDLLDTEKSKKLFCVFCQHEVTSLDKQITIEGSHAHTCTNPAGYVYMINCFSAAPGCAVIGDKTMEHTWFKGHEWQIAICEACRQHLGWLFSNDDQFFALIEDRITYSN